jgi:hexosaminidase
VRRLLGAGTGLDLPEHEEGQLRLQQDRSLPGEDYRLEVTTEMITITAGGLGGLNWAVQTLRQLIGGDVLRPAPVRDSFPIPAVLVDDGPRFGWRGVMLDVARHFTPLSDLFRFVDLIALHKYNVLHLHLTDDQGWRFESRRYPRLQQVASWRSETRRPLSDQGDGTPHGGFYTQDQLRALVRYAADRAVTVVPELEFPGHVRCVLAASPELGTDPSVGYQTATTFGVFDQVLSLDEPGLQFVLDLYEELLEVFPSPYVHVGGDEVPRVEWLASEAARRRAVDRGLPGPEHLQRWFTEQLRDWLAARGRRLVGWDEIMDEGPLAGSVVMAWRDAWYGTRAAAAGLDVVMCPTSHTYFDYYPSDLREEAYAIGGHLPVEQVYGFDPLAELPPEAHPRVLGTQCQVWTEYLPSARRVDYMMFPRACAHSEVAWSDPAGRSWAEFAPRLAAHLKRLDGLGVGFRPLPGPWPWQQGGTGVLARPRPLEEPLAAFQHVGGDQTRLGAPYHGTGADEALPPQRS